MGLFRQMSKTSIWSQLVLSIVAVFALPQFAENAFNQNEKTVINQSFGITCQSAVKDNQAIHQAVFLVQSPLPITAVNLKQAVRFLESFTQAYAFDGDLNHPIRAGPCSHS